MRYSVRPRAAGLEDSEHGQVRWVEATQRDGLPTLRADVEVWSVQSPWTHPVALLTQAHAWTPLHDLPQWLS